MHTVLKHGPTVDVGAAAHEARKTHETAQPQGPDRAALVPEEFGFGHNDHLEIDTPRSEATPPAQSSAKADHYLLSDQSKKTLEAQVENLPGEITFLENGGQSPIAHLWKTKFPSLFRSYLAEHKANIENKKATLEQAKQRLEEHRKALGRMEEEPAIQEFLANPKYDSLKKKIESYLDNHAIKESGTGAGLINLLRENGIPPRALLYMKSSVSPDKTLLEDRGGMREIEAILRAVGISTNLHPAEKGFINETWGERIRGDA